MSLTPMFSAPGLRALRALRRWAAPIAGSALLLLGAGAGAGAAAVGNGPGPASPRQVVFVIGRHSYQRDGQAVAMDAAPFIRNGRTLVPVRFLAEALGVPDGGVAWDQGTQTVTLTANGVVAKLTIGSPGLTVNGTRATMDVAPVIAADSHTYLPARYVAAAFGYQVSWDGPDQSVLITNSAALQLFTAGNYVGVPLAYNEVCFGAAGKVPPPPAFDQRGETLDPTDPVWPHAAGEVKVAAAQNVPVWFPDTGADKNLVKSCVNVGPEEGGKFTTAVPQGKYKAMELLEAGANANLPLDITLEYSDGSQDTVTVSVDDWCTQTPVGGVIAFMAADRMGSIGNKTTPSCGLFLMTVPIPDASKDLQGVEFALNPNDTAQFEPNILALTLQKP